LKGYNQLMNKRPLLVFAVLLGLAFASQSEILEENALIDAPFSIELKNLQDALGIEAKLIMNDKLASVGIKDVVIGMKFPSCQRVTDLFNKN
jgi:hypothetical protein